MSICVKCTGTGRLAVKNEETGGYDIIECPSCENRGVVIVEGSDAHNAAMVQVARQVGLEYIVVPDLIATNILEAAFPKKGLPGRTSVLPAKKSCPECNGIANHAGHCSKYPGKVEEE